MSANEQPAAWTWDAYLDWEARQSLRYELVDGDVHAMTGGTADHDTIATNLVAELRERLRGTPCRAHGGNLKVRAGANGRTPDALIDCGPRVGAATVAQEPRAVFEVLSRSTAAIDQSLKLRDYEAVASIASYVLVDQERPRVLLYARDGNGMMGSGAMVLAQGLDATLDLADPALSIPLAALYEGVVFDAPR